MVTGQNGVSGKNAQEAVGMATKLGRELAVTHRLSMVGGHVRGTLWKPSCVTLGLAQVSTHQNTSKAFVLSLLPWSQDPLFFAVKRYMASMLFSCFEKSLVKE